MMVMIEIVGLMCWFGGVVVVDNVLLKIEEGEFCCFIGLNGVGKILLFKCFLG